jgi:hypothetical protein
MGAPAVLFTCTTKGEKVVPPDIQSGHTSCPLPETIEIVCAGQNAGEKNNAVRKAPAANASFCIHVLLTLKKENKDGGRGRSV